MIYDITEVDKLKSDMIDRLEYRIKQGSTDLFNLKSVENISKLKTLKTKFLSVNSWNEADKLIDSYNEIIKEKE